MLKVVGPGLNRVVGSRGCSSMKVTSDDSNLKVSVIKVHNNFIRTRVCQQFRPQNFVCFKRHAPIRNQPVIKVVDVEETAISEPLDSDKFPASSPAP